MTEYLYGASVQGIQSFIFKTNKLQEIVGASQLVDKIFSHQFKSLCNKIGHTLAEENILISAAGNLKYLTNKETCEKIVKDFPKLISNYAPGITISQSVVKIGNKLKDDIDQLERNLKSQRNKTELPLDYGYMGLQRARRTGGVAYTEKTFDDRATKAKIADRENDTVGLFSKFTSDTIKAAQVPFDLNHITKKHDNAWIAIVHADGNGLGRLLSNLGKKVEGNNEDAKKAFRTFSKKLEHATELAAQTAFETVLNEQTIKDLKSEKTRLPFRPVVLGGDDLTVIIRADLAFDFTKAFLEAFEVETKEHLAFLKKEYDLNEFDQGLTACAGIAYVKQSYPFHYGVHLAESLTSAAKVFSKAIDSKRAPSSLYFYKVQASFLDDLKTIKKRTHYAKAASVSFDYGPYLISKDIDDLANINTLESKLSTLLSLSKEKEVGIGKFRDWLSELHIDKNKAAFMLNRMYQINEKLEKIFPKKYLLEELSDEEKNRANDETIKIKYKSIINDLIVLSSF